MTLILIIIYVFLLIAVQNIKSQIARVITISFVSFWMIALIVSTLRPYGILNISWQSYFLLVIGVISLTLGIYFTIKDLNFINTNYVIIHRALDNVATNKTIILLYVPAILFCVKYAIIAIAYANISSGADVSDQNENIFLGNDTAQQIFGYIITPMFHISLLLMSYIILNITRLWRRCLLHLLSFSLLFIGFLFIAGGRSIFIIFAVYFIITYICITPQKLFHFKLSRLPLLMLTVFVILSGVNMMSNYRTRGVISFNTEAVDKEQTAVEMIGRYSLLPLVLFDQAITTGRIEKYGRCYGRATLGGLDSWVCIGLNKVGIKAKSTSWISKDLESVYYKYDQSGTTANYAYTLFFYNYIDFGYLGIILWPYIIGILIGKVIKAYYRKPAFSSLLLLALAYFILMHSIFTCYLIKGWIFLYLVLIKFFNIIENRRKICIK